MDGLHMHSLSHFYVRSRKSRSYARSVFMQEPSHASAPTAESKAPSRSAYISSIMIVMNLPKYPEFAPLTLEMREVLYPALNLLPDGISEFTFSGLYLFDGPMAMNFLSCQKGISLFLENCEAGVFFYSPCCFQP